MQFEFYKYQACGNDFVLVDLLSASSPWVSQALASRFWLDVEAMRLCCDRKFGAGADGILIMLPAGSGKPAQGDELRREAAFNLHYLNADGKEGSLCGNGSRCAAAHAFRKGYFEGKQGLFEASDGVHRVSMVDEGLYCMEMREPLDWKVLEIGTFMNTGSPHLVVPVRDLVNFPVGREGKALREHPLFIPDGTNVNFMEIIDFNHLKVRTYERGVESETLSCGTGAVACALLHMQQNAQDFEESFAEIHLQFRGGKMTVRASIDGSGKMHDIALSGPANCSFKGLWLGYQGQTYTW